MLGCFRIWAARTAGHCPNAETTPARIGCSICLGGRSGTPTKYATICGLMWLIILLTTKRFWWSMRRRCEERRSHRGRATPVHRYRREDRKRPGGSLFGVCSHRGTHVDRPGAVPAEGLGRDPLPRRGEGARRHRVRHQTEAGRGHHHPLPGCRRPGAVGGRRRSYGADPQLRATLQDRRLGYVLGIDCNRTDPTAEGMRRVDELAASLPRRDGGGSAPGPEPRASAGTRGHCSTSSTTHLATTIC